MDTNQKNQKGNGRIPEEQPELTESRKLLQRLREQNCFLDLHLHLDGSLSEQSVRRLAKMKRLRVPISRQALLPMLQAPKHCSDLNEYLKAFELPLKLLQTPQALTYAAEQLCWELGYQGMMYVELRFAPQLHGEQGMTQEEAVHAVWRGLEQSKLPTKLILCCMRGQGNEEANRETLRVARKLLGTEVAAVDLAGAEALYPNEGYRELFAEARREQIPFTIHAGEALGAESVRLAMELGAKRIGHGVRALEDRELIRELAQKNIFLELCPKSNVDTGVYTDLSKYPLRELLQAGVPVTVNTDDMTVSHVTFYEQLVALTEQLVLTKQEILTLLYHAVEASYADEEQKQWMRERIRSNE